ncbi:MAG: preprotein translocase subunit SecE [Bacteroidales bacterium]|jgi:preprotein translocase subunit SecE|nr:preprotein translocase subunit SecE [Bacteroidales bacterium]
MRKLIKGIKDTRDEMLHKVSWPTWADLQESSIVVSVASLVIAGVVLIMDLSFKNIMELIYTMF